MDDSLIREECIDAQRQAWLGVVRISTPFSSHLAAMAASLILFVVLVWLSFGHYTRREAVSGMLVPEAGLLNITAQEDGTVSDINVVEGQAVRADTSLIQISSERTSTMGGVHGGMNAALIAQNSRLEGDVDAARNLMLMQKKSLLKDKENIKEQVKKVDYQIALAKRSEHSQAALLDKMQPLLSSGVVSQLQGQQLDVQHNESLSDVAALSRERSVLLQQERKIDDQLDQLPISIKEKIDNIKGRITENQSSILSNEVSRSAIVRSMESGTVTSLLVRRGEPVKKGQVLLSILPAGTKLQAQFLVSSDVIGFIKAGTPVIIHYRSFPYQKFGPGKGVVAEISKSSLSQVEVASLTGSEPPRYRSYKVIVQLQEQWISVYGNKVSLVPGMELDADMFLDRRRMIEWIFEPFFGLKSRVNGMVGGRHE